MATDGGEQDEIGRLEEDHQRHRARDLRQRGAEAAVHVEGQRTLGKLGVDNGDQVGHRSYGQELSVGQRPVEPTDQLAQHEGVEQKETQGKRPHERQERQQLCSRQGLPEGAEGDAPEDEEEDHHGEGHGHASRPGSAPPGNVLQRGWLGHAWLGHRLLSPEQGWPGRVLHAPESAPRAG